MSPSGGSGPVGPAPRPRRLVAGTGPAPAIAGVGSRIGRFRARNGGRPRASPPLIGGPSHAQDPHRQGEHQGVHNLSEVTDDSLSLSMGRLPAHHTCGPDHRKSADCSLVWIVVRPQSIDGRLVLGGSLPVSRRPSYRPAVSNFPVYLPRSIGQCAFGRRTGRTGRRSVVDWHNFVVSSDYRTIIGPDAQAGGRAIMSQQARVRTSVKIR